MRSFVLLIILGAYGPIHAAPTTVVQVVKVVSQKCGQDSTARKGSGFLFLIGGMTYVLTSEHVTYSSSGSSSGSPSGFCNKILLEKTWYPATLYRSDFGTGLALLKTEASLAKVSLQDLIEDEPSLPDVVQIGFPLRLEAKLTSQPGSIVVQKSRRHLLPLVDYTLETTGAYSEYGMSGGVLVDPATGKVLGLLSHQVLQRRAGEPTHVSARESDQPAEGDLTISIPSSFIRQWVGKALEEVRLDLVQRLLPMSQ